MKNLLLFVIISATIVVNSGCSSKLMSFEKRRYTQGYHVDFAEKKDKKNKVAEPEASLNIPQQQAKEIITACSETDFTPVPEIHSLAEETTEAAQPVQQARLTEKKKIFQTPILKHFTGAGIKAKAKHSLDKFEFKKNTAGTNQTMGTSFFTYLGVLLAGGCLAALAVMLFSNWASTLFLIIFLSGIFLGLIFLIIGANV